MRIALQLILSALIVVAVIWTIFRIPREGQALFGWAPRMALLSVWTSLAAVVLAGATWLLPAADVWIALSLLVVDPASLAAGVGVLWIYRGLVTDQPTVTMQRLQAKLGILLGLVAVAIGYSYVLTHKAPFTPVGM